ncbi:MAG TPA: hypothetical protein VJ908_12250 [Wenzhouxiangellaceae bacterium]|nr:hypothetical protein [Wenzhouxiangellaceae bacterium]
MLPITNHREFHIPHSLATAAAIIALVTAMGWDASDPSAAQAGEMNGLQQIETVRSAEAEVPNDTPGAARAGNSGCEPGVLSGLLPLVLPSVSGF